ncbi:FAD synthetase family protein [Treponema sp. OMZ 840]|uniref:FAD synthetase family protein n=1 Tax=Treponema sp. OMZ 840 TaxID=244313 RepID=UPI003D9029BA
MKVFSWDDVLNSKAKEFIHTLYSGEIAGSALTVGGFDGPHRGHETVCRRVTEAARKRSLVPGLITFTHSPRSFKQKAEYEGDISSLRLRLKVFEEWGFAFAVVIDFSADFSKMEGYAFLTVLKECCLMRFFGVGEGFRCGHNHATGETDIRQFAEVHGIECDFAALQADAGSRISSSAVRRYIRAGKLDKAAQFLGRPFDIDCLLFDIEKQRGKTVVLRPRAEHLQLLPPDGIYAADVFASVHNTKLCFYTDLHSASSVLRLEVPDADTDYRFDKIRFKM